MHEFAIVGIPSNKDHVDFMGSNCYIRPDKFLCTQKVQNALFVCSAKNAQRFAFIPMFIYRKAYHPLRGMVLIHSFCQKLRLKKRLQQKIRLPQRNQNYHSSEHILSLIYIIIAGLRRINKTEILQYNGTFLDLLGLSRFPDQSTLRRFLKRLPTKVIRQIVMVHNQLREELFHLPKPRTSLTFDLDSVVLVIYGKHQRAQVGYNPKKPGRRSYHPLLCFEAHLQEFWHGSLRPGNAVTSTGAVPFINVCLFKVPKTIPRSRIRFRADSGLFNKKVIERLDQEGCGYAIVAKEYPTIKVRARTCRFKKLRNGWEVGEFQYQPHGWKKAHRFVVVRRPIPEDPIEAQQLTLFKDRKYAYHVLVTNLKTHPWRVWRFYAKRATVEKNVRELLYDYPLGKIPTEDWVANVAFFQILLFAYNIVHWFKRLCLPKEYLYKTLETIRTDFLVLPARLTKRRGQNIIRLPHDYHYQKQLENAFRKISKLRIP